MSPKSEPNRPRLGEYFSAGRMATLLVRTHAQIIRRECQKTEPDWFEIIHRAEEIVREGKKVFEEGKES